MIIDLPQVEPNGNRKYLSVNMDNVNYIADGPGIGPDGGHFTSILHFRGGESLEVDYSRYTIERMVNEYERPRTV